MYVDDAASSLRTAIKLNRKVNYYSLIITVAENKSKFTHREVNNAERALDLHEK